MKKVSKFVLLIFSLLSFPLMGQLFGKITIEKQVGFTQSLAMGHSNLLIESIVIEITIADMAQMNEESMDRLTAIYANSNKQNNLPNIQEKNVALPLFKGELFPLKRFSHMEKQLQGTTPTLMLVQNTPKQVSVVPTNLKLLATHQNRPKALGSLLKF